MKNLTRGLLAAAVAVGLSAGISGTALAETRIEQHTATASSPVSAESFSAWHGPFKTYGQCESSLYVAKLIFHPTQVDDCHWRDNALGTGYWYAIA